MWWYDPLRWAVIVLSAINAGLIVTVWSMYVFDSKLKYVSFMALWGVGMILLSSTVSLSRLHSTKLTWHTPVLAAILVFGAFGFWMLFKSTKEKYHGKE